MKKLLSFFVLLAFAVTMYGQREVTRFLGIPVDGYKRDMIQKLKEKGFTYNSTHDCLEGEFNGSKVNVFVATNNNKVWRIMLADANSMEETDIKIRFNTLYWQFYNNKKYVPFIFNETLSDDENISYEMTVNKKRYEAGFYQLNTKADATTETGEVADSDYLNRCVWFMISEERYGKYYICMYYDNKYNKANGEDL